MRRFCAVIFGCLAIALIASTGCSNNACATDSDCGSKQVCGYRVGDCSAHGECVDLPGGSTCGIISFLCGCDGRIVSVYCNEPDGYASAPTVSAHFDPTLAEESSGTCSVDQDASIDAASD